VALREGAWIAGATLAGAALAPAVAVVRESGLAQGEILRALRTLEESDSDPENPPGR